VNQCFDLGRPEASNEDVTLRVERRLQQYFNTRYQTYNRRVRIIACWGQSPPTPESRRADATQHYTSYHPYAFVSLLSANGEPYGPAYEDVLLRKGVMQFSAVPFLPAAQFKKNAPLVWDYAPSVEQLAAKYASYICTKVVNRPVSFSGNNDIGKPRVLGLLHVQDPGYPGLDLMGTVVKKQVQACGGQIKAEAVYNGPYCVCLHQDDPNYAVKNMAAFQQAGVTTILWPGGWEEKQTKSAAQLRYYPEWVMAGDGEIDGYGVAQLQDKDAWAHAVLVSDTPRYAKYAQSDKCYLAVTEVDPSFPEQDARYVCPLGKPYEALRQLFTGIQLAGPRLTPQKVEEGFRAIPPKPSDDPGTPSCFYDAGDFTCVKDAQAEWWDSNTTANNGRPGCWKMAEGGKRYLAGKWPSGDVIAQRRTASDICNGWDPTIFG
jgi:hypothetical protein